MKINLMKKMAQRNGFFILLISAIFSMLIFSCDDNQFEPPTIDPNEEISFTEDIVPIFAAKCIGCHGGNIAPDLRPDKAYESLTKTSKYIGADPENNPEGSLIYTKLKGGHASTINEIELQQILNWVGQGAKNN